MRPFQHHDLARALLATLHDAADSLQAVDPFPSIDLAVVAFPTGAAPVWANVLLSRTHRQGLVARIGADAGPVRNISWLADTTDAQRDSIAWLPGADWTSLPLRPLWGEGEHRLIAPYPASLAKLMVLVAVAHLVDKGRADWQEPWRHGGQQHSLAGWAEPMVTVSSNEATDALVALLHARGLIGQDTQGERNGLHTLFGQWGLPTLRLAQTTPAGGWRNGDGAGVGQLQMTAWDTVRLLWLLMPEGSLANSQHPPWRPAPALPPLTAANRTLLWQWLAAQGLHEMLSTGLLSGVPGWVPGIPARVPPVWLRADGSAEVEGRHYPPDLRPAQARADALFAHKTGSTLSYGSDAGRVLGDGGRHYLIALTSSLGQRLAPHPACATHWAMAQAGSAIDGWLKLRLE